MRPEARFRSPTFLQPLLLPLVLACVTPPSEPPADLLFLGGTVLTMDRTAARAEAVAVRAGSIVAVGSLDVVEAWRGPQTEVIDLEGGALLPGFVDAHGHLALSAKYIAMANVASPPVGPVGSIDDLKRELLSFADAQHLEPGDWVLGNGYDDSLLAERRHPQREDLDEIFPDSPVFLLHVSGHLAAANSKALELAGIGPRSEDPQGGVIQRRPGSREPNGVLEEHAMFGVLGHLPEPSLEERLTQLEQAVAEYAAYGMTTLQEGYATEADVELFEAAAEAGRLAVDVVAYPVWTEVDRIYGDGRQPSREYRSGLRLGGVKITLDGSPQGKTAYLSEPYYEPPPGAEEGYRGYPAMPDEKVDAFVERFYGEGWQVLAHTNGDAASDQLLDAVEKARRAHPGEDRRTVMIHAQTVREDQLDRMKELGVLPSFFVAHTFYWGDWHRDSVLGPERAARISPARSALERGLRFTLHNDAPVVPPDVLRLVWTAVNRQSRSGQILGEEQRIPVDEALEAVTLGAAYQHFEEDRKGLLEVGKLADLVRLSADPTAVPPDEIDDIEVLATYKEGRRIFPTD